MFRTWTRDWGCGYFKADFMHIGSIYGPEDARWHRQDLSRIEIWMRMARLIREEIGEAIWLACGAPVWAPVGLADAMRIGRDIGVSWKGHYSAESLPRPDGAELRQRHPLAGRSRLHPAACPVSRAFRRAGALARVFRRAGRWRADDDHLGEVPAARRELFTALAGDGGAFACDFPLLGKGR